MTPSRVDQLVAGFVQGDAISREARSIRDMLGASGVSSRIIVPQRFISREMDGQCVPAEKYDDSADALIYHYGIESPADDTFFSFKGKRIIRYHNITPGSYFRGFDDELAQRLERGRQQLLSISGVADAIWAVSGFNAREFMELGVEKVEVLPLIFSIKDLRHGSGENRIEWMGAPLKNILFVGRVVPNKCIEELIMAFHHLERNKDPFVRLVIVGSERSCPRYYAMLRMLIARLNATKVCLKGFLLEDQLMACYQAADLFVSASRHEGFCLPLIEAMCNGVPVLARETGGMPEALGGAGLLFAEPDAEELAGLMKRVLEPGLSRNEILKGQEERISVLSKRDPCREVLDLLSR